VNILLVDDEPVFAETLAKRLRLRGFECAIAHDGNAALRAHAGGAFRAILLDLRLPDLSGLEVLKRVKRREPGVPVIIITAHGTDRDEKECRAAGACEFLSKPVDIDALVSRLDEHRGAAS
jgi:DNA-binding response OmpR family regulator